MTYGPETYLAQAGINYETCRGDSEADWASRTTANAKLAVYTVVQQLRREPTIADLPALSAAIERDFVGPMQLLLDMPEEYAKFAAAKEGLLREVSAPLRAARNEAAA